jgi:ATP-binding cassette subfamily C (CFTR/MRP) protein 4
LHREEVKVLRKRAYLRSFYLSLFLSSKKLIPYLTFLVYVLFGHTLSADKVFFAVSIFDVVIFNMISTLPSAAAGCGELVVAIKRIEDFLLLDEKKLNKSVEIVPIDFKNENMNNEEIVPFVRMQNVTAR